MISALAYLLIFLAIAASHRIKLISSVLFGIAYGLSYQIGHADFISYTSLYEFLKSVDSAGFNLELITGHYEPIYMLSAFLAASMGIDYYVFRFFLYAIPFYAFLYYFNKSNIQNKTIFLILFLSLTSYTHLFSVDRQAISILLMFIAIFTTNNFLRLMPLGFHLSSLALLMPILLNKSKKIALLSILLFLAIGIIYFDKYYYLILTNEGWRISITNSIIFFALVGELSITYRLFPTRIINIKILLIACLIIALVSLPFDAIFYRFKAIFILIILMSYFSRRHWVILDRPLGIFFVISFAYVVSVFYVLGDPLAFDGYQNVLLSPFLDYKDKAELWREIFQD